MLIPYFEGVFLEHSRWEHRHGTQATNENYGPLSVYHRRLNTMPCPLQPFPCAGATPQRFTPTRQLWLSWPGCQCDLPGDRSPWECRRFFLGDL